MKKTYGILSTTDGVASGDRKTGEFLITSLGIVYTVEPHVVFKYVFKEPVRTFYLRNYVYTGLFTLCLVAMTVLMRSDRSALTNALQNGVIAVGLAVSALGVVFLVDKAFRKEVKGMWGKMVEGIRKRE